MTNVRQHLLEDHARLELRVRAVAEALKAGDSCADLTSTWSAFETDLLDHLATEERHLFPVVASEHRSEVEALRAEHQHIRRVLAELAVAIDLHTIRKQAVDEFADFLRQHAAREDRSLYEWVDRKIAPGPWQLLFAMFERHQGGLSTPRGAGT